ncbi:hypothetical protein WDZ17_13800 [Pseudokineococcus basanitobsidens]|uniref:Methyltransferase family protein n=1 Tax=Pseudokineococcus basanitobsidens TaxID=1926649 RepID=A0ABU8RMT5_9ACTN
MSTPASSDSTTTGPSTPDDEAARLREAVRSRYAQAATTASCCGSVPADLDRDADGTVAFGAGLVLAEAARVLRPGGRLAFSEVVADGGMDEATKADVAAWTGCTADALTTRELTDALPRAGFSDLQIRPTHRVHTHAQAAIIRAVRPGTR